MNTPSLHLVRARCRKTGGDFVAAEEDFAPLLPEDGPLHLSRTRFAVRQFPDADSAHRFARDYARQRGIIIADTKFEFGLEIDPLTGEPVSQAPILVDEVLTPDSSRYWPADQYQEGVNPPSFDKQYLRDWLETATVDGAPWNKQAPAPTLPAEVISLTASKYHEAWTRLQS